MQGLNGVFSAATCMRHDNFDVFFFQLDLWGSIASISISAIRCVPTGGVTAGVGSSILDQIWHIVSAIILTTSGFVFFGILSLGLLVHEGFGGIGQRLLILEILEFGVTKHNVGISTGVFHNLGVI